MSKREEIYKKLRPMLLRRLMSRHAMRLDDCEDIAQETMLILHTKYGHLDKEADVMLLSFKILAYKRLEFVKKERRYGELPENFDQASPDPNAEVDLLAKHDNEKARTWLGWLRDTIGGMNERCRKLLQLRLEGRTTKEIAIEMSMTENYVGVAEFRCKEGIRQKMPNDSR